MAVRVCGLPGVGWHFWQGVVDPSSSNKMLESPRPPYLGDGGKANSSQPPPRESPRSLWKKVHRAFIGVLSWQLERLPCPPTPAEFMKSRGTQQSLVFRAGFQLCSRAQPSTVYTASCVPP